MSAPDLSSKTAIVTGATRGIGKETAVGLARMGATVVVTARDVARGESAVGDVKAACGHDRVELVMLDLASLESVRRAASAVLDRFERIDVLVNNAGSHIHARQETQEGFELTFGANYLGPFLFTNLLLERIKASAPARIVNVTSAAHRGSGFDFADLQWTRRRYRPIVVYGRSKLANVLFAFELAERLQGTGVTANAVNPGIVATNFGALQDGSRPGIGGAMMKVVHPLMRSPAKGAETSIWAATASELDGVTGEYFANRRVARPSAAARDRDMARRLWQVSEELTADAGVS